MGGLVDRLYDDRAGELRRVARTAKRVRHGTPGDSTGLRDVLRAGAREPRASDLEEDLVPAGGGHASSDGHWPSELGGYDRCADEDLPTEPLKIPDR